MSLSGIMSLEIEERTIRFHQLPFDEICFYDSRSIRAAELYGMMRSHLNREVDHVRFYEINNCVYIEVYYVQPYDWIPPISFAAFTDFFVLSNHEMSMFLEHYCNIHKSYVDWKKEGF
jgi:hypothetical protein